MSDSPNLCSRRESKFEQFCADRFKKKPANICDCSLTTRGLHTGRTKSRNMSVSASLIAKTPLELACGTATNFREFLSSVMDSEDIQNAPEDLLITAIDFAMITAGACFGLLHALATIPKPLNSFRRYDPRLIGTEPVKF